MSLSALHSATLLNETAGGFIKLSINHLYSEKLLAQTKESPGRAGGSRRQSKPPFLELVVLAGAFSAQQFLEASKDKGTMTRLLPMSQSHGYKTELIFLLKL